MSVRSVSLSLPTQDATTQLARAIAGHLRRGDTVLLEGQIGSGKSHFARSAIQSLLSEPEDVPSPTFTIVQTYNSPGCEIWHVDLYRLTSADELFELGLEDAIGDAICIVEWPDKLGELRPDDALTLCFAATELEGYRNLAMSAASPRWDKLLDQVDA